MWPFRHNSLFSSKKKSCNPHTPFSFVAHNTIPGRKKQSKRFHQNYFKRTTNKPDIFCHSFKASALSQLHLSPLSHSHTLLHLEAALSATFRGGGGVSTTVTGTALAWGSCERYSFTFLSKCAERQSHENKMLAGNVSANTFMSGLY